MRALITSRNKQDWMRIRNLVGLGGDIEVVQSFENTADVIASVCKFMPDILILDIDYPPGQGIHMLEAVHREYPSLEIIVLSNYSSLQHRRKCKQEGASLFFEKSTEFQQLPLAIKQYMQRFRENTLILS